MQAYEPKNPLVRGVDVQWLHHVFLPYVEEHCWPTEGAAARMSCPQPCIGQQKTKWTAPLHLNSFTMLGDALSMIPSPHASVDQFGGATDIGMLQYINGGPESARGLALDTKAGQAQGCIEPRDRDRCITAGGALSGHGSAHAAVSGSAGVVNAGGHVIHSADNIFPIAEVREYASAATPDSNTSATSASAETPPNECWQASAATVAQFTEALVKRHASGCSYYSLLDPECGPSHSLAACVIVSLPLACSMGLSRADITLEDPCQQYLW